MKWSEETCLNLIDLYHNATVLWDPSDPNYYKKHVKADAWREIGKAMNLSSEICKNKIVTLLSSFRREKAKLKKSEGTGKGTSKVYRSSWFAFNALSFIMDRNKPRKRIDIITLDNKDDTDEDGIDVKESIQPPKKVPKQDQKLVMLKEVFGTSASTSLNNTNDEIKSFVSFIENKMKKYNEYTKNIVQQAICEIIFKADSGYYNQNYFGNYPCNAQPTHAPSSSNTTPEIPISSGQPRL